MDVRDQLQKTLGDAYTLERELGGGGISRVFVATEASLGRRVVAKAPPGASGGSVSIERFKREIQLAAWALELEPSFFLSSSDITRVLATAGRAQEALVAVSSAVDTATAWLLGNRGHVLAKAGRTAEARAIAARLATRATVEPIAAGAAAYVRLALGEIDAAMDLSISAARRGSVSYLPTPDYDPLRTHPRYPELLRALGLHDQPIAQWKGRAPAAVR